MKPSKWFRVMRRVAAFPVAALGIVLLFIANAIAGDQFFEPDSTEQ